jgi:hypothetical protein
MTSGHDVSEYLDTFGLVKSYFLKFFEKMQLKKIEKKSKKKMSWCSHAPEDEVISLFGGLLANPDMTLSRNNIDTRSNGIGSGGGQKEEKKKIKPNKSGLCPPSEESR